MNEIETLKKHNFSFNKSYGQNFIFDTNLLKAIVMDSGAEGKNVLEIGCGAGTLTRQIALKAKKVVGYEIDQNLKGVLDENLKGLDNVNIVFKDIMKVPMSEIESQFDGEYIVVANLPYYITTPIIFKFVEESSNLTSLSIMVQKEVGDRLTAKPGSKDYGAITISLDYRANVNVVRIVKRNMFTPAPNVDSCVVKIDFAKKYDIVDSHLVDELIRCAFQNRRKMFAKNIKNLLHIDEKIVLDAFKAVGIDQNVRGEALATKQFVDLSNQLCKLIKRP